MLDDESNPLGSAPSTAIHCSESPEQPFARGIWTKGELAVLESHIDSYTKLKRTPYLKATIIQEIKRWWKDRYTEGSLKRKERAKEWRKKKTVGVERV